jgi:hypothetical protein
MKTYNFYINISFEALYIWKKKYNEKQLTS